MYVKTKKMKRIHRLVEIYVLFIIHLKIQCIYGNWQVFLIDLVRNYPIVYQKITKNVQAHYLRCFKSNSPLKIFKLRKYKI